ncbi:hypothetical protein PL373_08045 [Tenacibaculum maritimum]|nr:hypothetical protein [Tenacibaculum maritimum]MDB0601097.1 hypothetical protein [Tenacibaculum maritimum]MDB0612179.1 hypothetical protein [Tenacibaculum maritimum]
MVLKYFVGGAIERRRVVHLNNDLSDCRLSNLRWRKGFIDDVDYKFLSEINTSKMSNNSLVVRDFLITEDIKPLFDLLKDYEKLLRYKDYLNNTYYLKNNDFIGFCLIIVDRLKEGQFKPNIKHKEVVSFKDFICSTFVTVAYQYKSMREFYLPNYSKELSVLPDFGSIENNSVFY